MKFKEFIKEKKVKNGYYESLADGILFNDGTEVYTYHTQDCCESVYAKWDDLEELFFDQEFKEIEIENVPGAGFRINGFFVPCYNCQNGYYSDNLTLVIVKPDGFSKKIPIEKKDDIN